MRKGYPSDIKREQFEVIRPLLESARRKTAPRKVELLSLIHICVHLLGGGRIHPAGDRSGADVVVDAAVPAGRLAAPQHHF